MSEKMYDVIVAGGGTAGIAAAAAAGSMGAKTLLIEKNGHLGGTSVTGIPLLGVFDGNGIQAAGGFVQRFTDRLISEGGAVGHIHGARWSNNGHMAGDEFILTPFDSETAKYVAQEMVLEAGVDILLHSYITEAVMSGNKVSGITAVGKSGTRKFTSSVVIDATGDADICALAGAQMLKKERVQNSSILFTVNGVDTERLLQALEQGENVHGWGSWHSRIVSGRKIDSSRSSAIHIAGHFVPWDDESTEVTFTAVSVREHEIYLNATRTVNIDGTDADSLTRGEIAERRNIKRLINGLRKNIPGFEKSYVSRTAPIGIRESRTVIGDYLLQEDDVLQGRDFSDSIARGAYPSDIHDPKGGRTQFLFIHGGGSYAIPYRCLLPKGIEGILVAGRTISASQKASGTVRLQGTVMAQGQAAGTAAALACIHGTTPRELSITELQRELKANGAVI